MKTEQELRQLARDIKTGAVFTSNHIPPSDEEMIGSIFMPLMFMDEDAHKVFLEKKPGMIFERMDKAMPRSVNGYPIFMSFEFVTEEEYQLVRGYYKELQTWEQGELECQVPIGADDVCGLPPNSQIHVNNANPQRHDFMPKLTEPTNETV